MERRTDEDLAKVLWDYHCLRQEVVPSDLILVLGSNDIRVAQHGARLFLNGLAPLIAFAGSVGPLTKGVFSKPEAEVFAEEATKLGVPEDKMLIENRSTNTGANFVLTKQLIESRGLKVDSLIAVTKPYMLRRAYATCRRQWPEVKVTVSSLDLGFEEYLDGAMTRQSLIEFLTGYTERMQAYVEQGFQIPQEMPDGVWHTYEELARRGYTARAPRKT